MFELSQQIDHWRHQLQQNEAYRSSDIDELESHLKDEIETLKAKGLSDEEAFWVAHHRLGDIDNLQNEFGKVNRRQVWQRRLLWLLGGYLLINVLFALKRTLTFGVVFAGSSAGLTPEQVAVLQIGFSSLLLLGAMGAIWSRSGIRSAGLSRVLAQVQSFGRRTHLVFLFVVLFALFAMSWGVPIFLARALQPSLYGKIVYTAMYTDLVWKSLPYLFFVILFVAVSRWRKRTTN